MLGSSIKRSMNCRHREGKILDVGRQRAAVLSSHRASRHMPSASLGHYAPLSFVVIGR
jgi:hypothetical protein